MTSKNKTVKKTVKKPVNKTVKKLPKLSNEQLKEKRAKAVKAHNRKVAADNAAFAKLKPAEKRVAIARDVLKHLASRKIIATHGTWVDKGDDDIFINDKVQVKNPELQTLFSDMKSCNACALGGMFMCAVEKADKLKVSDLHDSKIGYNYANIVQEDVFSYMKKFFTEAQLNTIEATFEQNTGACVDDDADWFAPDVQEASERMRLIMENIIANNGTFKPKRSPIVTFVTPGFVS